jgi:hypothetical protein
MLPRENKPFNELMTGIAEREQLAAIVADRNRPRKHVERAGIVLASADRHSAQQVAQRIGVSQPTVWRWQQRFAESGIEGLLRDKTRKPGKAPIAAEITARVVALTCTAPAAPGDPLDRPGNGQSHRHLGGFGATRLTRSQTAAAPAGTFKRSRDPSFAAKLTDIVGLYRDPPAHADKSKACFRFGWGRFVADSHPRWELDAGMSLVRFCAGVAQ